jgi:polar amino acid transport system substrate-binding protein
MATGAYPGRAGAQQLHLVSASLPPYSDLQDGRPAGVAARIVEEMAKRVGHDGAVEMLPWARAQQVAEQLPEIGIFPLGRTPERENSYRWISLILSDDLVAVTRSNETIASLDECSARLSGAMSHSPALILAQQLGMRSVDAAKDEITNARKLMAGRIDCWFSARFYTIYAVREAGYMPASLRTVATLGHIDFYLAGSKSISDEEVQKWQDALSAIKASGLYEQLLGFSG